MKLSLYQISHDYLSACEDLSLLEGELTAESIADTLESLSGDFDQKAINVAGYLKNIEAEALAMADYEAAMAKRRKVLENKICGLKKYLVFCMKKSGIHKIKGPEFNLTLRKALPKVCVTDNKLIPAKYYSVKMEETIDKQKLKDDLKEGVEIPGAMLEYNSTLIIK